MMTNAAVNIHVQVFIWTYIFIFLGSCQSVKLLDSCGGGGVLLKSERLVQFVKHSPSITAENTEQLLSVSQEFYFKQSGPLFLNSWYSLAASVKEVILQQIKTCISLTKRSVCFQLGEFWSHPFSESVKNK